MRQVPKLPFPHALQMPLRDIMRGVATVADLTEEALEPAASILPGPVRNSFRSALSAFEEAGRSAFRPQIDCAAIARASDYLAGRATAQEDADAFVDVLAFAWERLFAETDRSHRLFSETIAAASLAGLARSASTDPFARAAALFFSLRRAHAAGGLPGLPILSSDTDQTASDMAMVSILVWLMADRASDMDEEETLLDLAAALTRALAEDVSASLDDPAALAARLADLSDHL